MLNQHKDSQYDKQNLSDKDRELYWQLFVNRHDDYAYQEASGGYKRAKTPLTEKILFSDQTVGTYNLDRNSTVINACLDFDIDKKIHEKKASMSSDEWEKWIQTVRQHTKSCFAYLRSLDIPCYAEFSGYKGFHIWLFLDKPMPAAEVRQWLRHLRKLLPAMPEGLDLELFPKQDTVSADGFGNFVKFPLQVNLKSGKYSHFLDTGFNPIVGLPEITRTELIKLPELPAAENVQTASPARSVTRTRPTVTLDIERLPLVTSNCEYTKELLDKLETQKYLTHPERIWLANILVQFGDDVVHTYFSKLHDYDEAKTSAQLASLIQTPSLCSFAEKCKNQRCSKILSRGNVSPIAFAYNQLHSKDVDPEKPWIFYNGLTETYQYYLQGKLHGIKKNDIENLLKNFDLLKPDYYPLLIPKFDPHDPTWIDFENNALNFFKATEYLELSRTAEIINPKTDIPTILRLLENLAPDAADFEYAINWFSVIMNTRNKLRTALIYRGPQGAGKGLLFSKLLSPLFGRRQCKLVSNQLLEEKYTGYMKDAFLVGFNEVAYDNKSRNKVNPRLKSFITDETVWIEDKFDKAYEAENRANFLFFSNEVVPVVIEAGDRRFTVIETGGNLAERKDFGDDFVDNLTKELPMFAQYLKNYPYDAEKANKPLQSDSKMQIMEAAMDRFEEFAMHLKNNDGNWLNEALDDDFGLHPNRLPVVLPGEIRTSEAKKFFNAIYTDSVISTQKLKKKLQQHGITAVPNTHGHEVYRW